MLQRAKRQILKEILTPAGDAVRLRYYHRMSKDYSYSVRRPQHLVYYHCYLSLRELYTFSISICPTETFSAYQMPQMTRYPAVRPIQSEDEDFEAK